ncbi:MAG: hypothetical protein ACK559_02145, partial [bacterium]
NGHTFFKLHCRKLHFPKRSRVPPSGLGSAAAIRHVVIRLRYMRRATRFRQMRDAVIRLPVSGEAALVGGCCGRFSTALVIPAKDTGGIEA